MLLLFFIFIVAVAVIVAVPFNVAVAVAFNVAVAVTILAFIVDAIDVAAVVVAVAFIVAVVVAVFAFIVDVAVFVVKDDFLYHRFLTFTCGLPELRHLVVGKLEMWLINPKISRPSQVISLYLSFSLFPSLSIFLSPSPSAFFFFLPP